MEQALLEKPWRAARPGVWVKLLAQEDELYVFAESRDRVAKERAMRRRQLKWLWARLKQLATMRLDRDDLLMKLGAARAKAPGAWRLIEIELPERGAGFTYRLDRQKLRQTRRREGRYLLCTNLMQMIDVYVPTTDGRELSLTRNAVTRCFRHRLLHALGPGGGEGPRRERPIPPRLERMASDSFRLVRSMRANRRKRGAPISARPRLRERFT